MRTNTTLALTIGMFAAFTAGCADAPTITGSDATQPNCSRSNVGTGDCRSLISALHPSASVFYEHDVQGLGVFSSFAQPASAYVQGTTKIDISTLTDLSFHNSISDGVQTVGFLFGALQRRTVPSTWGTWSSPPQSESATPPVLHGISTLFTALTFSQPAAVVGFEVEGNTLGAHEFLVEFYDEDYTLLGIVRRTVESNAGARLFSFSTDWPKKISRVDISGGGGSGYFAIAQIRYSLTPLSSGSTAITIDIKPGTSPNDVHRSSKGRVPVAVLTTAAFNAANIDVASVTLGDEVSQDTPVALQNKGVPMASLKDVDGDGDLDLILQFDIPALVANGDLTASTTQLVLKGTLMSGGAVRGGDNVMVKP